jgi:hypothetical protein
MRWLLHVGAAIRVSIDTCFLMFSLSVFIPFSYVSLSDFIPFSSVSLSDFDPNGHHL